MQKLEVNQQEYIEFLNFKKSQLEQQHREELSAIEDKINNLGTTSIITRIATGPIVPVVQRPAATSGHSRRQSDVVISEQIDEVLSRGEDFMTCSDVYKEILRNPKVNDYPDLKKFVSKILSRNTLNHTKYTRVRAGGRYKYALSKRKKNFGTTAKNGAQQPVINYFPDAKKGGVMFANVLNAVVDILGKAMKPLSVNEVMASLRPYNQGISNPHWKKLHVTVSSMLMSYAKITPGQNTRFEYITDNGKRYFDLKK